MRILIVGGTGFIGPYVVRELARRGHEVAVFHRGKSNPDLPAEHILGERADLQRLRPKADIVIDLILSSGQQAQALMDCFRGVARRAIAASSCDVYRACGVLHGSEPGPLEPVPLTEESPLRTKLQTYPPERLEMVRQFYPWVGDEYDKIPVERAILGDAGMPGTVCRLPMVYGPRDPAIRFFPLLRRIADGRGAILYEESWAAWKAPRGYVENVAAAIALAAVDDRASGRVYNIADQPAYSELEWARKVAAAANWRGEFAVLSRERMPEHLRVPGNPAQHWETSTARIERELGFHPPIPAEEGIRRTVEWDLAHLPGEFPMYSLDYAAETAALRIFSAARRS